jgi:hypothetical protein
MAMSLRPVLAPDDVPVVNVFPTTIDTAMVAKGHSVIPADELLGHGAPIHLDQSSQGPVMFHRRS